MEKKDLEQLLKEGNSIQLKPVGYSMYPMLVQGRDEVRIRAADPESLRRGDVVLYRRADGILVLHRLLRRGKDGFYLVGDNQTRVEGPVPPEQVRGILIGFVRKGRYISAQDRRYRMAASIWLALRPFRRLIAVPAAAVRRKTGLNLWN